MPEIKIYHITEIDEIGTFRHRLGTRRGFEVAMYQGVPIAGRYWSSSNHPICEGCGAYYETDEERHAVCRFSADYEHIIDCVLTQRPYRIIGKSFVMRDEKNNTYHVYDQKRNRRIWSGRRLDKL